MARLTEDFLIDFEWLSGKNGSAVESAAFAELSIKIAGKVATELEDLSAKTVRRSVRASAYHLGIWLAANWWRLRWEPLGRSRDWQLSHRLTAAGGGYLWPDISFSSDGDSVTVEVRPTHGDPRVEPARYLGNFDAVIPAESFERGIDSFLNAIVERLGACSVKDEALPSLIEEVLAERRNPELSRRRKLEALAGFDPDAAPGYLLDGLVGHADELGFQAMEELAAGTGKEALSQLETLLNLRVGSRTGPGMRLTVPDVAFPFRVEESQEYSRAPWELAVEAARNVRDAWGLGVEAISDRSMADILSLPEEFITGDVVSDTRIAAAFREEEGRDMRVFLNKRRPTSRRFALARLVGDHLNLRWDDALRPATEARTARQKYQRAFAQEFLCPFGTLLDYIGRDEPDDDTIESAAAHFLVSPLLVKTTLVNRGRLSPEALPSW